MIRHQIVAPSHALLFRRFYASTKSFPPKFGFIPPRPGFFNWKAITVFFSAGAALSYSEFIFDKYADYTAVKDDPVEQIRLQFELSTLPLYEKLLHPITGKDWMKLCSWENLDRNVLDSNDQSVLVRTQEEYQSPQLTNKTLATPGGIAAKPVIFYNTETDETVTFVHLGYKLCGYPFIVHGGILATVLNETFKRNASLSKDTLSQLKSDYKVEELNINYKAPSLANQFFVVKTEKMPPTDTEPDLYHVKSVIESQSGKLLVQSEAKLRNTCRGTGALRTHSGWREKLGLSWKT